MFVRLALRADIQLYLLYPFLRYVTFQPFSVFDRGAK